jgi:hypothetical protein
MNETELSGNEEFTMIHSEFRETVYREYSCARWNYWTYCDGSIVYISKREFDKMISQGAKLVTVN